MPTPHSSALPSMENKKSGMIAITNYSHAVSPHGRTPYRGISVASTPAINLSTFFYPSTRSTCSTRLKPFSAFSTCPCRRVHNHYTKRILNLTLNRKNFLRRENGPLDKQKPRQNRRGKSSALHLLHQFRQLCAEALHHPFSNMSSQPCIFHCPLR